MSEETKKTETGETAEAKDKTTKKEAKAADPGEELVKVRLFKDNERYKDDVFVAVNGQSVRIRRGEAVEIKKKFADVLEQSMEQDQRTAGLIDEKVSEYKKASAKLS